jgi:hypothetical protein
MRSNFAVQPAHDALCQEHNFVQRLLVAMRELNQLVSAADHLAALYARLYEYLWQSSVAIMSFRYQVIPATRVVPDLAGE